MSEEPDSTAEKDDDVEVVEVVLEVGETAAASWGASRGNSVAIRRSATIFDRDNDMDDQAMNLDSPDVRAARQLPDQSQGANQAAAHSAGPGH